MIDLHADTIYRLWEDGDKENLISNSYMVDKNRLVKGGVIGQCFALYTPMYDIRSDRDKDKSPWGILNELHDRFLLEIKSADIPQMISVSDLDDGKLHAILTTEEGASIEGDLSRLQTLKDWGVKIFGLTWNFENELGYPNSKDPEVMNKGLKEKGIECLQECERLGIIVDVSHLSDGGFWDVVKHSTRPFAATHSNSRALTGVTRNLTDQELKALSDKGGVAGINFAGYFLRPDNIDDHKSTLYDMARHIKHMINIAGEDVVAIGTDFDGIGGELEVPSPDYLYKLHNYLAKEGLKCATLDKIFNDNAKRLFASVERGTN